MKLLDSLDQTTSCARRSRDRSDIRILVDYFTAWNDHDVNAILGLLTDDATYVGPLATDQLGGRALRREIDWLWAAFPDLWFEIESLDHHDDESAVAQWLMHGTNTQPILGRAATHRRIRLAGADFFRFRDGLIAGIRSHFDSVDLVRQLGIDVLIWRS
ncbi:MAG: ester cyclase [Rhizobiaceae bacterium]